jgi:hypothetical protein
MSDEEFAAYVHELVTETLRITVPINKRRCAIRAGVRESSELEAGCDHADWDHAKYWCNVCGVTARELVIRARQEEGR